MLLLEDGRGRACNAFVIFAVVIDDRFDDIVDAVVGGELYVGGGSIVLSP